ncbi:glycosyltransferase [Enterococcus massiliensis]|uniref:glycosyltransferase n=1 Tax=Enterococcus massiliensis TaxID=1640685 RepID=UPI00065E5067|nr:glycosyltransferase [Enterococcus massiliensis]
MLRVLNVIGRRPTGGIGAVVKNYQSNFSEKIIFDYLLFSDEPSGEFDVFVQDMGSKVYVLPALKMERIFLLKSSIKKFFSLHSKEYDILHIHTVNIAFLVAKYAKYFGIQHIIAHSHATKFSDKKINAIRNKILCANLAKICNEFIACSNEAGYFLFGKKLMDSGKVKILKNAIDINKYKFSTKKRSEFRNEFNLKDEILLANIGRLSLQKNQEFLISIFQKFQVKVPNSRLFIVGSGEELSKLQQKVKKLKLEEYVVFTGKRSDIDKILSGIDVFVMPSLYEGLPVIGVEALSSGLPCIFSNEISKEFYSTKSFYMPLEVGSSKWSEKVIDVLHGDIDRNYSQTKEMGYDIKEEAPKLLEYYRIILNRSEN